MAAADANTTPKYPLPFSAMNWGSLLAANTAMDGTGTVLTLLTAGANGSRLDKIIAKLLGTNVVTLARVFLNNGASQAVAANNTLIRDMVLPAFTIVHNAANPQIEIPIGLVIPPAYKVHVVLGTAVAAGWQFTPIGGDY